MGALGCASLAGLSGGGDGGVSVDASSHDATMSARDARSDSALGKGDATRRDGGVPDAAMTAHADTGSDAGCTVCNGACVDTTSNASNCGGCNISCRKCTNSYCLNYLDDGDPGQAMTALAFVSPLVYWVGAADGGNNVLTGDIVVPSANPERIVQYLSGAPLALATDHRSLFIGGVGYIGAFAPPSTFTLLDGGLAAVDAGVAYLDAGKVQVANSIAVDDANVYWTDSTQNTVVHMPKTGGPVVTLITEQFGATGITVDSTYVYWVAVGSLFRIAIGSSGVPATLASTTTTGTGPTPLVVVNGVVYYPDTQTGRIVSIEASGGTPIAFAMAQANPTALATDGTSLYWTTNSPSGCGVVMAPLGGGAPVTIGELSQAGIVLPGGIALATGADGGAVSHPTVFVSANVGGVGTLLVLSAPPD